MLAIAEMEESKSKNNGCVAADGIQLTCFSEESDGDVLLHFQIIRLQKQVFSITNYFLGCQDASLFCNLLCWFEFSFQGFSSP